MIFQIGLLFHIIGIFLIAGGAVGNILTESLFWKYVQQSPDKSQTLALLLKRFPSIILTGSMLMIVSGVLMLFGVNWIFVGQPWFTIKILLYIILLLNGILVAKPTVAKIVNEVQSAEPKMSTLMKLRKKIRNFHIVQFSVLFLLVAVAIFKI
jgi:uncharacterized membrane protein